jgi:hypothetical protein
MSRKIAEELLPRSRQRCPGRASEGRSPLIDALSERLGYNPRYAIEPELGNRALKELKSGNLSLHTTVAPSSPARRDSVGGNISGGSLHLALLTPSCWRRPRTSPTLESELHRCFGSGAQESTVCSA